MSSSVQCHNDHLTLTASAGKPLSRSVTNLTRHNTKHSTSRPSERRGTGPRTLLSLQFHREGSKVPLKDVTDFVVSSEYSCTLPSRADPESSTADSLTVSRHYKCPTDITASVTALSHHQKALGSKPIHWDDHEGQYSRLKAPPQTPDIERLDSPELEDIVGARFCCCCDSARYQEQRAKMDSQRMSLALSSSSINQDVSPRR